jgi:hypothetical protein
VIWLICQISDSGSDVIFNGRAVLPHNTIKIKFMDLKIAIVVVKAWTNVIKEEMLFFF